MQRLDINMEIIWTLMLTVCSNLSCGTQTIQWFDEKPQCLEMKLIHENIPTDGNWKSIEYTCTIVGAKEI
tara:strand:+ start:743 stop:952 length:210 start_codon:yes stop_codon:yes gene_type:complete